MVCEYFNGFSGTASAEYIGYIRSETITESMGEVTRYHEFRFKIRTIKYFSYRR